MAFEQLAHRRNLAEILRRHRRDLEAALALGHDQPLRAEPAEQLAHRADAGRVALADAVQAQFFARSEAAEDDVGAQAAIGDLPNRFRPWGTILGECPQLAHAPKLARSVGTG